MTHRYNNHDGLDRPHCEELGILLEDDPLDRHFAALVGLMLHVLVAADEEVPV